MDNVTEVQMIDYLEAFHTAYRRAADARLPEDLRAHLSRYAYLDRPIVGYVSTLFGAGYEYSGSSSSAGYSTRRGSSRVEDLLFDAPAAVRKSPAMILVGGANCGIARLTMDGAFPVRLTSKEASVRIEDFRAKAGGWVREVSYAELFGDRSAAAWSPAAAVERALDEILVAVVDAREVERRDLDLAAFLERFRQQKVLLLGDFRNGRNRLEAVAALLEESGYLPVFADDIPDIASHDLRQKVFMLALACRFVVIEDSSPAGQLTEIPLVENARQVTVVLRLAGQRSSWMSAGISDTSSVIREFEYEDATRPSVIADAVAWVEAELARLERTLDALYPWRRPA